MIYGNEFLKCINIDTQDNDDLNVPAAGKEISLTEEVPKGIRRRITFGNIMLVSGTARNFQIGKKNGKDRVIMLSPNDTNNPKDLTGSQVLREGEVLVAIFAAGADEGRCASSISYEDYLIDRQRLK